LLWKIIFKTIKMPAYNVRFCESGAVTPQKIKPVLQKNENKCNVLIKIHLMHWFATLTGSKSV
jgi:hypothetical protein